VVRARGARAILVGACGTSLVSGWESFSPRECRQHWLGAGRRRVFFVVSFVRGTRGRLFAQGLAINNKPWGANNGWLVGSSVVFFNEPVLQNLAAAGKMIKPATGSNLFAIHGSTPGGQAWLSEAVPDFRITNCRGVVYALGYGGFILCTWRAIPKQV